MSRTCCLCVILISCSQRRLRNSIRILMFVKRGMRMRSNCHLSWRKSSTSVNETHQTEQKTLSLSHTFSLISYSQNLWSIALEKLINESKLNKQMNQHFINPINHLFIEVAKYLNIEDFGKVF